MLLRVLRAPSERQKSSHDASLSVYGTLRGSHDAPLSVYETLRAAKKLIKSSASLRLEIAWDAWTTIKTFSKHPQTGHIRAP